MMEIWRAWGIWIKTSSLADERAMEGVSGAREEGRPKMNEPLQVVGVIMPVLQLGTMKVKRWSRLPTQTADLKFPSI